MTQSHINSGCMTTTSIVFVDTSMEHTEANVDEGADPRCASWGSGCRRCCKRKLLQKARPRKQKLAVLKADLQKEKTMREEAEKEIAGLDRRLNIF